MTAAPVVVTGATGLIGSRLCARLRERSTPLSLLVRRPDSLPNAGSEERIFEWDGTRGAPPVDAIEGALAVVHLAGAGIASGRWSSRRKAVLRASRVDATRGLVEAIERCNKPPSLLISGSAIGIYGDRGDEQLTEESPAGSGFLAELASDWEAEACRAEQSGTRVVLLRTGVVLSRKGGALPEMVRPFRFFVGGRLGSGRQFISWIHIEDEVDLILHLLDNPDVSGPVNAVAPEPVQQHELARTLGNHLRRPAFIRTPGWALRLMLGEMAGPLLLEGQRVLPDKAVRAGFEFRFGGLDDALSSLLSP